MHAGFAQRASEPNSSRAALFLENTPVPLLQFSALFASAEPIAVTGVSYLGTPQRAKIRASIRLPESAISKSGTRFCV
jgi:hypothetical protein